MRRAPWALLLLGLAALVTVSAEKKGVEGATQNRYIRAVLGLHRKKRLAQQHNEENDNKDTAAESIRVRRYAERSDGSEDHERRKRSAEEKEEDIFSGVLGLGSRLRRLKRSFGRHRSYSRGGSWANGKSHGEHGNMLGGYKSHKSAKKHSWRGKSKHQHTGRQHRHHDISAAQKSAMRSMMKMKDIQGKSRSYGKRKSRHLDTRLSAFLKRSRSNKRKRKVIKQDVKVKHYDFAKDLDVVKKKGVEARKKEIMTIDQQINKFKNRRWKEVDILLKEMTSREKTLEKDYKDLKNDLANLALHDEERAKILKKQKAKKAENAHHRRKRFIDKDDVEESLHYHDTHAGTLHHHTGVLESHDEEVKHINVHFAKFRDRLRRFEKFLERNAGKIAKLHPKLVKLAKLTDTKCRSMVRKVIPIVAEVIKNYNSNLQAIGGAKHPEYINNIAVGNGYIRYDEHDERVDHSLHKKRKISVMERLKHERTAKRICQMLHICKKGRGHVYNKKTG